MQSYLIVGGTRRERIAKAEKLAGKYRVSQPDKIILDADRSLGIDQVRRLQHQLSLKPYSSKYKMAIIAAAEKLTVPAQNAMLKILEEPPNKTVIILACPTGEALLPTIVSRCQIISLLAKPQIEIDEKEQNFQIALVKKILNVGVGERIKLAAEIAKNRDKAIAFCQAQLIIWRKKMIADKNRQQQSVRVVRLIQKTLKMLEANVNPRLAIENLLFNYPPLFTPPRCCRFTPKSKSQLCYYKIGCR